MATNRVKVHYIDNSVFLQELIDYKEKCNIAQAEGKPKPVIPNSIGIYFMKISERLSHRPNFLNYSYRSEMVADAIENCLRYVSNFDPKKSVNPFAYFTQIIWFAFLRRIHMEKKQVYIKCKIAENYNTEEEFVDVDNVPTKQYDLYDNLSEFIQTFEDTREAKKVTKKLIKRGLDLFQDEL